MKFYCLHCYCLLIVLICGSTWSKVVKREAEVRQEINPSGNDGSFPNQGSFNTNLPTQEIPQVTTGYTLQQQNYFQPSTQFEYPSNQGMSDSQYSATQLESGDMGSNQWTTSTDFTNHYPPHYQPQNQNMQTEMPLQSTESNNKEASQNNQFFPSNFYTPIMPYLTDQAALPISKNESPQNSIKSNQFPIYSSFDSSFKSVVPSIADFSNIQTIDLTNLKDFQDTYKSTKNMYPNQPINYGITYPMYSLPIKSETPQMDFTAKNNLNYPMYSAPIQMEIPQMNNLNYPMYSAPIKSEAPQMDLTSKKNLEYLMYSAPVKSETPQMNLPTKTKVVKHKPQKNTNLFKNTESNTQPHALLHMYINPHLNSNEMSKPHSSKPRYSHSPPNKCYNEKPSVPVPRCKPMKQNKDKPKYKPFLPTPVPTKPTESHHSHYESETQSTTSKYNLGSLHYIPDSAEHSHSKEEDESQRIRPVRFILKRTMQPSSICDKLPIILSTLMCG